MHTLCARLHGCAHLHSFLFTGIVTGQDKSAPSVTGHSPLSRLAFQLWTWRMNHVPSSFCFGTPGSPSTTDLSSIVRLSLKKAEPDESGCLSSSEFTTRQVKGFPIHLEAHWRSHHLVEVGAMQRRLCFQEKGFYQVRLITPGAQLHPWGSLISKLTLQFSFFLSVCRHAYVFGSRSQPWVLVPRHHPPFSFFAVLELTEQPRLADQ